MNSIEETLFNAANQLRDPEKQVAYLDLACANNPELRQRIESLLRAGAQAKQFFANQAPALAPELAPTVEAPPPSEAAGMMIGRYKLLQQIGEGGCGVVYMAEQSEPVKRRVALKLIKLGMDAKNVIARFEAERQALAMMDHPNIAKVLDAGTSESGRPYFVMELVRGMKITEYCDEAKLATRERLDLFVKVCHAIQHAHQKGIIHRDIKPSNILVTVNDGVATPKVIDFGIAKATTGQQLTDKTLFTAFEQFIGTPAYMSPEQVVITSLDIDTRSDIYSLGVLLYELLTGKTPFDAKELLAAGFDEMRRTIREKEPSRPSTRVSTLPGEELSTTAHRRGIEPPKLANVLRGDLDWIVMKALEKDRTRRYETANGFAMDIQRHLNNEPVVACPPSAVYRLQKMVRRNKLPFAFATGVAGVLVLGVIVSTWQMVRATRAEREQTRLRGEAEKARAGEAAQRRLAEEAGERVATKARILGELHEQAEKARNSEAQERVKAQQNLYGSLVREARATRLARRVGYREAVFKLIQQARGLDVPNKDLTELRLEAVACLGDFVGLTPTTFTDFPTNTSIQLTRLDSTGRLAAFALSDGTILLRELPSGKGIARLNGEHATRSLCFSAAGDRLISVQGPDASSIQERFASAVVHVWAHATNGNWGEAEKLALPGANQCLSSVDGLYVTVADLVSHSIELFDVKAKAVVHRFESSKEMSGPPLAALSPDGKFFVAEAVEPREPNTFRLDVWDLTKGERAYRIDPRLRDFAEISFSSDGKHLACLSGSGGVIYAVNRFERVAEFREHFEGISSFGPSATMIPLPLVQQNRVRLWDLLRSEDVAVLEEPQPAHGSAFNLDGNFLLTNGDHHARLYPLNLSAEKLSLSGHVGSVPGIAFSPDGSHLASVGKDRTLKVWDALTGRLDWERGPLPGQGQFVAWSPDGHLLVTTDYESQLVWVWSVQTRTRLLELGTNSPGRTFSAQFSPHGQYLVTAGYSHSPSPPGLRVWALERHAWESGKGELSAKLVKSFDGPSHSLVLEPNGQKVAYVGNVAGNFSSGLYTWTINRTTPPRLLTTNLIWSSAQCESFTSDGLRLLTLDTNRCVTTLDLETGNKVSSFPTIDSKHRRDWAGNEHNLSLSPDGTRFAVGTPSSLGVDLWDPKTGRLLYSLPEQSGTVYWLAWSPDSQRLAVSRSNGDIAIWNLPEIERVFAGLGLSP